MLDSPARRSGVPEWSCETRWTEAASVRQNWMRVSEGMPECGAWNEQTQREPEMRRQRRDCESGVPGIGDATMEEWNKKPALTTIAANRAILLKRLITGRELIKGD